MIANILAYLLLCLLPSPAAVAQVRAEFPPIAGSLTDPVAWVMLERSRGGRTEVVFDADGAYRSTFHGDRTVPERSGSWYLQPPGTSDAPWTLHLSWRPAGDAEVSPFTDSYYVTATDEVMVWFTDTRIEHIFVANPETPAPPLTRLFVEDVRSDTVLEETTGAGLRTYPPVLMIDELLTSFWSEGAPGSGVGEELVVHLPIPYESARGILVFSGVFRTADLFRRNGRPRDITISAGASPPFRVELSDTRLPQYIPLPLPQDAHDRREHVQVRIDSVYPGSQWNDTCITEIVVVGIHEF